MRPTVRYLSATSLLKKALPLTVSISAFKPLSLSTLMGDNFSAYSNCSGIRAGHFDLRSLRPCSRATYVTPQLVWWRMMIWLRWKNASNVAMSTSAGVARPETFLMQIIS